MELNPNGTAPVYSTLFGTTAQTFGMGLTPTVKRSSLVFQAITYGYSERVLREIPRMPMRVLWSSSRRMDRGLCTPLPCVTVSRRARRCVDPSGTAVAVGLSISGTTTAFQSALLDPYPRLRSESPRRPKHCRQAGYFGQPRMVHILRKTIPRASSSQVCRSPE